MTCRRDDLAARSRLVRPSRFDRARHDISLVRRIARTEPAARSARPDPGGRSRLHAGCDQSSVPPCLPAKTPARVEHDQLGDLLTEPLLLRDCQTMLPPGPTMRLSHRVHAQMLECLAGLFDTLSSDVRSELSAFEAGTGTLGESCSNTSMCTRAASFCIVRRDRKAIPPMSDTSTTAIAAIDVDPHRPDGAWTTCPTVPRGWARGVFHRRMSRTARRSSTSSAARANTRAQGRKPRHLATRASRLHGT